MCGKKSEGLSVEKEWGGPLGAGLLCLALPTIVFLFWVSFFEGHCNFIHPQVLDIRLWPSYFLRYFTPNWTAFYIFAIWWVFQSVLYLILPGDTFIALPQLDTGISLSYKMNGLFCYVVTLGTYYVTSCCWKLFPPSLPADHIGPLLTISTVWAYLYATYLWLRGTNKKDNPYVSGKFAYDFWTGTELNPRSLWGLWDHKYFCEGHPGLISWILLNFCMAAKQYEKYGEVSTAMWLVCGFHFLYILDCWVFEPCLTTTLDIYYERFGFMLVFGDLVWVVFTYTLIAYKLIDDSPVFPMWFIVFLVVMDLFGLLLFRGSNLQKHLFRMKPEKYGHFAHIKTDHGKLLIGAFWGWAQHLNYCGDLIMGLAWCLCSGFDCLLGYFYIIYFTMLLIHRQIRDEARCRQKYGTEWKKYTDIVLWRIFPYIY